MNVTRRAVASLAIATGMLFASMPFAAAKWPMDKPITIVVPWPAGTGADLMARVIAEGMTKKWGAQVQVENRTGASGNIGQAYVAKADPDGYTFIVTTPGPAANNKLTFKSLSYDPLTDFTFITQTNEDPMMLIAGPRLAAKDMKEFTEYAKANAGKVQFGHPGIGTYAHMTQLAMQEMLGTTFNLVPYRGAPQMITDLHAKQVDAVIDLAGGYMSQIQSGQLRALAIIGNSRMPQLPNVPTFREQGINFTAEPWYGMEGPKGIPRDIVDQVNKVVAETLAEEPVRKKLIAAGVTPRTGTPEALEKLVKDEIEKWRPIIVKYKISAE